MPEKEFEIYLSLLSQLLRLSPAQKAAISDELRDHMEQRLTSLLEAGLSRDEAIRKAMHEFGDVSGLAVDLTRASRTLTRKVVIRSTLAASVAAVVIVIWVTLFVPEHRVATPPAARAQPVQPAIAKATEAVADRDPVPSFPLPSIAEAKYLQALDTSLSFDFKDMPVEEALSEIEKQSGIEIWIDKQAATDSGINADTTVTLKLQDISLRNSLKLMLKPMGLIYLIEDEVMKITTPVAAQRSFATRVYPVADLFESADEATQLLQSIECGLRSIEAAEAPPNLAVSSRIKTLTVRQSFPMQLQMPRLLRAYRDAIRDADLLPTSLRDQPGHAKDQSNPAEMMPSYPLPTAREAVIQKALDVPTSGTWSDQPLSKVLNDIKSQHHFEVWIDAACLEREEIDVSVQATFSADKRPLRECLRLLLEPLALTYLIEDDVMKITTQSYLDTNFETRIYPVGDLVSTADEATQLLETIECGLGQNRLVNGFRRFAVSSRMKTLTVSDTYAGQVNVRRFLLALRDAHQASAGVKADRSAEPKN